MKKWILVFGLLLASSSLFATDFSTRLDVVRIDAAQVASLIGTESQHLFLLAYPINQSKAEGNRIALQVIQRYDQNGALILGENKLRESKVFSKRDQLILMARDLGRQVMPKDLPMDARLIVEIEAKDVESGESRFGYLVANHFPPMLGTNHLVGFDAGDHSIFGQTYFMRLSHLENKNQSPFRIQAFAFRTDEAKDGAFVGNILEDNIFRARSRMFWNLLGASMEGDDLSVDVGGFVAGSVAVMRRLEMKPKFGSRLFSEPIRLTQSFYDQWMETHVETKLSGTTLGLASHLDLELGEVFSTQGGVSVVTEQENNHAYVYFRKGTREIGFSAWALQKESGEPLDFVMISESGDTQGSTVLRVDLKKQGSGPFRFVIRRYFPPRGDALHRQAIEAVSQNPLKISARPVNQNVVFQLPRSHP